MAWASGPASVYPGSKANFRECCVRYYCVFTRGRRKEVGANVKRAGSTHERSGLLRSSCCFAANLALVGSAGACARPYPASHGSMLSSTTFIRTIQNITHAVSPHPLVCFSSVWRAVYHAAVVRLDSRRDALLPPLALHHDIVAPCLRHYSSTVRTSHVMWL